MDISLWAVAAAIVVFAGFVKGATGFALPMIMISGLGSILPPETALAMLILPTVASNVWQAFRGGRASAAAALRVHWRYVAVTAAFIVLGGQLLALLSPRAMYLVLGGPILLFAVVQLAGVRLVIPPGRRRAAEVATATVAGLIGGISGVWGPPTVLYLTALDTPKREQMQVQGVVFGLGSVMLLLTHLQSGILNAQTLPLSAAAIVPALIGMALGFVVHDRLDQARFRQATLWLIVVAGLNLIRRGLT